MKRRPKSAVRRTVWLDYRALELAREVLRDERSYVSQRSVMTDAMRRDYDRCEEHLVVLMERAMVRR
jgi:hypothetical protein